jgi:hypothetical protein
MIMMTINAYENRSRKAEETKAAAKVSVTPNTIAPNTAPGRLPSPPTTAAIKAFRVKMPIWGQTVYLMPNSTPPNPADEPAKKNTNATTISGLMPIRLATRMLYDVARMALPIRVP